VRNAIIDLGSNTFHLLIVDTTSEELIYEVYRQRIFVSLGDGGIDVLQESAMQRGLHACQLFADKMREYKVENTLISGTAALRTAENRNHFIEQAEAILEHPIMVIDGKQEATYIFKGVKLLSPMKERTLIIDIGGGSTEFIIVEDGEMVWSESYKLGVNVLHDLFHHEEPISAISIDAFKNHIRDVLDGFISKVNTQAITTIVGSSGSFEIFESMSGLVTHKDKINNINLNTARQIIQKIIVSNRQEREAMDGLPLERTKLIVVGMLLVNEVLEIVLPSQLIVSPYALKEGLLSTIVTK
jgi:exopolyphosphatase / guanosine-5'-triphosphate,3'-diphosphate pyrophosphatase